METVLRVRDLCTFFFKGKEVVRAVNNVDLEVHSGETLALVGESGCGKSTLALSLFQLVPFPGRITAGRVEFEHRDILQMNHKELRRIRGRRMSLIFQDPHSALNPVMRVGEQIAEVIRSHLGHDRRKARQGALELIERMYLPNPERVYDNYPHQLSGGQQQRIIIAIALSCRPTLVVADEPTSALDVSIQGQILTLLKELKREYNLSLLLITHDLGVVSYMSDRVAVMYAGTIVEEGPTRALLDTPAHPYTASLLAATPRIPNPGDSSISEITPLNGAVPDLANLPSGCPFHPRCPVIMEECPHQTPQYVEVGDGRRARCLRSVETAYYDSKSVGGTAA